MKLSTCKRLLAAGAGLFCLNLSGSACAEASALLEKTLDTPDWLTIRGSHRTRFEVLHDPIALVRFGNSKDFFGASSPDEIPSYAGLRTTGLVSLQTSLFLEATLGRVRIGAELMDARSYNPIRNPQDFCQFFCFPTIAQSNAVEPIQAYFAIDIGDDNEVMLGRFTMEIGSGRLVARSAFRNIIQSYYGVKGTVNVADNERLTVFYTLPYSRNLEFDNEVKFDRPVLERHFWGAHYEIQRALGEASIETYLFGQIGDSYPNCGAPPNGCPSGLDGLQFTSGLRAYQAPAPGRIDFDVEGAAQFTNDSFIGPTEPNIGFFAHAEIGRTYQDWLVSRVSVILDAASAPGTKLTEIPPPAGFEGFDIPFFDRNISGPRQFDPLYGDFVGDFGPEGLFDAISRSNIISGAVRFEAKPTPRVNLQLTYRASHKYAEPNLSVTQYFPSGIIDSFEQPLYALSSFDPGWAHQADIAAQYWIVPDLVSLEFGGAIFSMRGINKTEPLNSDETIISKTDRDFSFYGYSSIRVTF